MKGLLRLYPRSWRKRYGLEMEALLEDEPVRMGTALDVLLGAGAEYARVIRGNRILSAAGAYVHGVCVAVLLQALAYVGLILVAQGSTNTTEVTVGPVHLATVMRPELRRLGELYGFVLRSWPALEWLVATACLIFLGAVLVLVVRGPRWVRAAAR